ncbi:hypothetical protein [Paenibacillus sp. IHBB 10380]|nr:hypothetical protein [Paenibacillus sp. IHBB 10380]
MDASESDWDMDIKRSIFGNMTADGYMAMLDEADHFGTALVKALG